MPIYLKRNSLSARKRLKETLEIIKECPRIGRWSWTQDEGKHNRTMHRGRTGEGFIRYEYENWTHGMMR